MINESLPLGDLEVSYLNLELDKLSLRMNDYDVLFILSLTTIPVLIDISNLLFLELGLFFIDGEDVVAF